MDEQLDVAGPRVRPRVVVPIAVGAAVVALLPWLVTKADHDGWHPNDLPGWPAPAAASPFDEGAPLHCSGVESMTPTQAVSWLTDRGFDSLVFEARPDGVVHYKGAAPTLARLREVQVSEQYPSRAVVEVVTLGHPEYDSGYTGPVPKQACAG